MCGTFKEILMSGYTLWVSLTEGSKLMGISKDALRRRGSRGTVSRKRCPDTNQWLYEIAPSSVNVDVSDEDLQELGIVTRKGYVYIKEKDFYLVYMGKGHPWWQAKGEIVRAIRAMYASGQTDVGTVCREFGIDRRMFLRLKTALHMTKLATPLTDEELESKSEVELVSSAVRHRERRVMHLVEKREQKLVLDKAAKWDNLHFSLLGAIEEMRHAKPQKVKPVQPADPGGYGLFLGLSDLHFGMKPHNSIASVEDQYNLYLEHMYQVVSRAILQWGTPERVWFLIGSDMLHIDSERFETKAGTPQGPQSVGTYPEHIKYAIKFCQAVIDHCRQFAHVDALWIKGNHDASSSVGVAMALHFMYEGESNVSVDIENKMRKCRIYRGVPMLMLHGHGAKAKSYSAYLSHMAMKEAEPSDIGKGIVFRGHFHAGKEVFAEDFGLDVVTISAPTKSDTWHHESGYDLGHQQRMSAYRISEDGYDSAIYQRLKYGQSFG